MSDLTITITLLDINGSVRPQIQVGDTQTVLGTCYNRADALADSLRYIDQEFKRGDWSKFALFRSVPPQSLEQVGDPADAASEQNDIGGATTNERFLRVTR